MWGSSPVMVYERRKIMRAGYVQQLRNVRKGSAEAGIQLMGRGSGGGGGGGTRE